MSEISFSWSFGGGMEIVMKYDFDEIRDRSSVGKWEMPSKIGAIGMGVADMDFKLAPEIIEAVKECAEIGEFGYGGMKEADYNAILDWLAYRGKTVPREYIVPTPGVLYSARAAMYMLTNEGDKVIVQTPLHTPSIATAAMQGRIPLVNRLKYENGRYDMDFDDLERCFKEGAKVLMMCAPNNPTGRVWTMDELKKIATLVKKYDAYIVCDEIHRDIIWKGYEHISPTELPEIADRTVSVFSTSKTFNMGGFHIGSAIIPNPELRNRFKKQFYSWGHTCERPSTVEQAAQTAAYNKARGWYEEMMAYVNKNFDIALDYLSDLPIHASHPEGTFLLWTDVSAMKLCKDDLNKVMLNDWKVHCDSGVFYDTADYMHVNPIEHHVRINLATTHANVEEAFDRIRNYFKK